MKKKILIIHTILWSHYKGAVFSELYKLVKEKVYDLKVIHIAINLNPERTFTSHGAVGFLV